jgi:hypothetical protein
MMAFDWSKGVGKATFAACTRESAFQSGIAEQQERKRLSRHSIQLSTG